MILILKLKEGYNYYLEYYNQKVIKKEFKMYKEYVDSARKNKLEVNLISF